MRNVSTIRMAFNGYSILPIDIQSQLILKPETGMGYQDITFEMLDGTLLTVQVENGAYVKGIDITKIKAVK